MNILRHTRFLAILQKSLLVILVATLVWAHVWQSAHALTHIGTPALPDTGNPDIFAVQADVDADADSDSGTDNDEACPDCLAFTAAKSCLPDSTCYLFDHTAQHCWFPSCLATHTTRFFSPYRSRAPPVSLS